MLNKFFRKFASLLALCPLNEAIPLFLALCLLDEGGLYHIAKPSACKMKEVLTNDLTIYSCMEEVFSVMPFHLLSNSVIFPFAAYSCLSK